MNVNVGIVFLVVVFLVVLCSGERPNCPTGIWCRKEDETEAKLARREGINKERELKHRYRRINWVKRGDRANNADIKRQFEGYFSNY